MKTHLYYLLVLAAPLAACGNETPSQSAAGNGTEATAQATTPPVAVGTPGKAEGLDFTVTSVDQPSQIGPAGVGPKAESGETFVVVRYTLKNTAAEPLPLMERPGLSLIDANGQTYAPDQSASMLTAGLMDDPSGMASDLNPNVSAKTAAAWKVDKATFDPATWKVVVATDPSLTFSLK